MSFAVNMMLKFSNVLLYPRLFSFISQSRLAYSPESDSSVKIYPSLSYLAGVLKKAKSRESLFGYLWTSNFSFRFPFFYRSFSFFFFQPLQSRAKTSMIDCHRSK